MFQHIKKSKLNFCYSFYEDRLFKKYYTNYPESDCSKAGSEITEHIPDRNFIRSVTLIPEYLGVNTGHLDPFYGVFCYSYQLGFAIRLTGFDSAESYLRTQLGKKVYKNLRQDRQRLEKDFDIQWSVYHESISKKSYEDLMQKLKSFIVNRFEGKTSRHAALQRWMIYLDTIYDQILNGTASLFVLSDGNTPITIALNYHYKNILYAAIISFDHRYHRYSLGRQMFYKQIEWCYDNGYQLIDLAWGSFDYKIKFSNAVYKYQTHVIYPKTNFLAKVLAFIEINKLLIIYYLVMIRDRKLKNPKKTYKGKWLTKFNI